MLMCKRHLASAVAFGALALSVPAAASPYGVKVGALTCTVDSGWGYVLGSSKDVHCTYHPNQGADDHYVGSISKFGLDLGYTSGGSMVWDVVAPTSDLRPGALQGDYAGATASATLAAGVGANVLLGGFDKSIALQPVSFSADSGLDISAGIGALDLRAAPETAAAAPPPERVSYRLIRTETYAAGFGFGQAALTPAARVVIRDAAHEAGATHPTRIVVTGHADTVGTDRFNDRLSLARARAVRDELIRDGADPSAIEIAGRGDRDPAVPTAPGVRQAQNRCVTIRLRGAATTGNGA